MTTHAAAFGYTTGQTLTAKLFVEGSDTVAYTADSVTEETNKEGVFVASFTDVSAGKYRLVYFLGGSGAGYEWYTFTGTDGERQQPWSDYGNGVAGLIASATKDEILESWPASPDGSQATISPDTAEPWIPLVVFSSAGQLEQLDVETVTLFRVERWENNRKVAHEDIDPVIVADQDTHAAGDVYYSGGGVHYVAIPAATVAAANAGQLVLIRAISDTQEFSPVSTRVDYTNTSVRELVATRASAGDAMAITAATLTSITEGVQAYLEANPVPASNMRGTDGAYTGTPPDTAAIADSIRAKLVAEPVPASNMRGTDGAYTGTPPDTAAIASQVSTRLATDFGPGPWTTVPAATIRDEILNRLLAGNHDTDDSLGKIVQDIATRVLSLYNNEVEVGVPLPAIVQSGYPAIDRAANDFTPVVFEWETSGATITARRSITNGAYADAAGAVTFLRTEGGKHLYTIAQDAADRPALGGRGLVTYELTEGDTTEYLYVQIGTGTATAEQIAEAVQVHSVDNPVIVTVSDASAAEIATQVDLALLAGDDGVNIIQALADKIADDWVQGDTSPLAIVAAMKSDAQISQLLTDAATTKTQTSAATLNSLLTQSYTDNELLRLNREYVVSNLITGGTDTVVYALNV